MRWTPKKAETEFMRSGLSLLRRGVQTILKADARDDAAREKCFGGAWILKSWRDSSGWLIWVLALAYVEIEEGNHESQSTVPR